MKRQTIALPFSLLFIAITLAVVDAFSAGGWTPIKNMNDTQAIEIAEFAITEHNKQASSNLELDSIVKGLERDAGDNKNYQLVLTVKGGKADEQYEADVNVSGNLKALILFVPLKG
jgi:hypothetical protein